MSDSDENMSAISDEEEDPEIYDLKDLCVLIGSKKTQLICCLTQVFSRNRNNAARNLVVAT